MHIADFNVIAPYSSYYVSHVGVTCLCVKGSRQQQVPQSC